MSDRIGIDLGTSRCSVAVLDEGKPRVVPTATGEGTEPSWVSFAATGPVAGEAARRLALERPERTIFGAVRLLGRKFQSPEGQWLRAGSPYAIVAAPNGDLALQVAGRDRPPQEVVSYLIEHLKRRAEQELGRAVESAAIAIAPSFDILQRRAVIDAARLAGLSRVSLVNATSAAAVAWAAQRPEPHRIAIVSLGAGSLDVSLVELEGTTVEVIASAGDPMLGGDDMDRRLALHFVEQHRERTGSDVSDDPGALQALFELARSTRLALSDQKRTEPVAQTLGRSGRFEHPGMSRRQLVEVIAPELARLKEPCLWVFEDAGLGTDDLDAVIATGGGSRMPAVQSVIKYLFGRPPLFMPDDDTAIAIGAARIAEARSAAEHAQADAMVVLHDVALRSIGIKVRGGQFLTILSRNLPLPGEERRLFQVASSSVTFELYEGDNELSSDNTYLGRFTLSQLAPGPLEVVFALDESGILGVSHIDQRTGASKRAPLALAAGLGPAELSSLLAQREERSLPQEISDEAKKPGLATLRQQREALDQVAERRHRPQRTTHAAAADPASKLGRRPPDDTLTPPPAEGAWGASATAAIAVDADSLVGTLVGERYLIEAIVGEGGMGRVYRAQHALLKKLFAIKVLHPELAVNRELGERFVREARAASSIVSEHVVAISDFGLLADGAGYFVMEYLEGRDLEEVLELEGPQSARFAIAIGRQIADALRGAHEREIVHRDLKPSNILIQSRGGKPYCKILDFGIAKSPTSDSSSTGATIVTMVGVMMGTPHYMAPEQIDGDVDPRSDIYALGVVLFETLCGTPPFDAESIAELLALHKWTPPPAIHEVHPSADCSPALEAIIRRCLEKDAKARYQSARELGEALAKLDP